MKPLLALINILVILLGIYMIMSFGKGALNPPMISGIAFILLGASGLLRK